MPGPQTGSFSGKYMDTASHVSALMTRGERGKIAALAPCVLSYKNAAGKPEAVWLAVPEDVCVSVWLAVCVPDALVVWDADTLGVSAWLLVGACDGDGEQIFLRPVSSTPRKASEAAHDAPAVALVQLARTLAATPAGTVASPTLYHATALDAEMTSAYVVPYMPDVSKSSDERGRRTKLPGTAGTATDATCTATSPWKGA